MAYIPSTTRARIEAQIATKEEQLAAANTAYTAALSTDIQSYTFDSGEGRQSATRRKPQDIAFMISRLESELNRLYRRLDGTGLVNMNLRRHGGAGFGRIG